MEKYNIKIKPDVLTNKSNPNIKKLSFLLQNKNKKDLKNLCVVESIWAHQKILETDLKIKAFFFCDEIMHSKEAIELVKSFTEKAEKVFMISRSILDCLSPRDRPDGVFAIIELKDREIKEFELEEKSIVLVLDGIEKPGNVGTIIRTADGAGIDGIIVCNKKARLSHTKTIKSSHGEVFLMPIFDCGIDETIKWLKDNDFEIYLTDTSAKIDYKNIKSPKRIAIIAGNERYGISSQWYDVKHTKIKIPMFGNADSLNVAIATSIFAYEFSQR